MTAPRVVRAVLALAAAGLACGDPSAPVRGVPVLPTNVVVGGSIIAGGTNSFLIETAPDADVRLFLQATSGQAADTLVATVTGWENTSGFWGSTTSVGTDTSLDDRVTAPIRFEGRVRLLVTVRGSSGDDAGPYKLVLRTSDPRPETVSGTIAIGDTVAGESIDRYGDVDEFTFAGREDDEVLVFVQLLSRAARGVGVAVLDSAGAPLGETIVSGVQRALEERSIPVRLPATGRYRIRLTPLGNAPFDGETWRGAYRLRVYPVNRAPEGRAATVAVGDTVAEAIDAVGDIDEFTFTPVATQELYVALALERRLASDLRLEVWRGSVRDAAVATRGSQASLEEVGTGRFLVDARTKYTVRVSGATAGVPESTTVAYRFELYPVDRRPESIGSSAAIGDTVRGEAIGHPGDLDEFTFAATAGEQLNLFITAPTVDPGESLLLEVVDPSGSRVRAAISHGGSAVGDIGRHGATDRFTVAQTGTYTARVSGAGASTAAYAVEIYRINPAPESAAPVLALGTPVTESFDRPGDVDKFTFDATAGQEVNIFITPKPGMSGAAFLEVSGMTSGVPFAVSWEGATGLLTAPETKTYGITVIGDLSSQSEVAVGPYEVLVFPINRAPETAAATFAVGDTVTGESIYPAGDIDEFTFTGTAGEELGVYFAVSQGVEPGRFTLVVFNDRTKEQVLGLDNGIPESIRYVPLPSTDTYRVRVVPTGWARRATDVGGYRFALVRR